MKLTVIGRPTTPTAFDPGAVMVSFTASSSNAYITSYYIYGDSGGTSGVNTNPAPGEIFSASATNIGFLGTYFRQFSVGVTDSRSNSAYVTRSIYVINPPPPPPPPAPAPARYELFATDPDAAETAPGETPNPGKFLFVRTGAPGTFDFYSYTFSGTARQGLDYTVAYGTPVYTTNNTTNVMSQEITINPVDDYFYEGDETVKLELCFPIITFIENGGAGAPTGTYCTGDSTNANAYATLTIHDNELLASPYSSVTVAATDVDAAEVSPLSGLPPNPGVFTVTRTAPVANNLTVNFSLAGKAVNGVDFLAVSNFIVIPAGANSAQVVINPIYDLYAEGDEPVTLTLRPSTAPATNAAGYLLDTGGSGYSAAVIIHDYAPTNIPVVKITVTDPIATTLITPFPYYPYNRTATMVVSRTGSLA